ncbi:MAG: hypothetical protein A3F35_01455 [Candidatus Woykebacteria bacterium RIFCSPHIGHO2_12_FULL_45_10]|uniref:Type II secretion system protein GspG C-terminal domain-containing protein n=1 Tax=Candidatus Woykebacteria bacterium RIFCSPHIGHO2_12_FULL_45_10 TaxID=1802603 RepID=A0A1G1WNQ6_9BACT|nr:MAG: hypothetical protein A3F35_01455 [Candidatus Woykebacteria bacterium RIFCSPHIGHO2_12_FULL_45_10]
MLPKKLSAAKGFTLIEILVVIGILAILLTIVLVAINPAKNTQDARNIKRRSDVLNILNAVNQYYVAVGSFPTGTPADGDPAVDVKSAVGGTLTAFCSALVTTYIAELPFDPSTGSYTSCTTYDTHYTIEQTAAGRIKISAPDTELNDTTTAIISVTR